MEVEGRCGRDGVLERSSLVCGGGELLFRVDMSRLISIVSLEGSLGIKCTYFILVITYVLKKYKEV